MFNQLTHRTHWNTGELQAMHRWRATQHPSFLNKPITTQVQLAQQAVLPRERQRENVKYFSHASKALTRMIKAAHIAQPTVQQTVQTPAFSSAPVAEFMQPTACKLYVQQGTTMPMNMPKGTYTLEIV